MSAVGKRFLGWITHNALLKILSLIFGFAVWLVVVNYSNPKIQDSVTLTYDVLNEKSVLTASQVYSTDTSQVKISYTVRSKFRSQVRPDAFTAYIDLDDYSVTGSVPVYYEIDSSVADLISDISVSPAVIHVTAEKIQQKKFAVSHTLIGTVSEGYVEGKVSVSPEYIYVKGPVSVIGKITSVGIEIDVSGAVSEVAGTAPAAFYDANGSVLRGIEERLSYAGDISYTVPVYQVKSLTVNAFTGGAPASGYTVDGVDTSPTFISVYGPDDLLNEYSYILIPGTDLNISGITENKTFNLDARDYLPEGLFLKTANPEITVYVRVRSIREEARTKSTVSETIPETLPETQQEAPAEADGPGATLPESAEDSSSDSAPEASSEEPGAETGPFTEETAGSGPSDGLETEEDISESAGTEEDSSIPAETGAEPSEGTEGFESGPGSETAEHTQEGETAPGEASHADD